MVFMAGFEEAGGQTDLQRETGCDLRHQDVTSDIRMLSPLQTGLLSSAVERFVVKSVIRFVSTFVFEGLAFSIFSFSHVPQFILFGMS